MRAVPLFSKAAFFGGAVILAIAPTLWLIETWMDPSYASQGGGFFIATMLLGLYALSSPRIKTASHQNKALLILAATAAIRILSEILAINTLGALVLAADIYAIALLLGLHERVRSVSPFWLSVSFLFCLPIERIIQRVLGFALQSLSADGACHALGLFFKNVSCAGVRITIEGADVLVDLPCSGARAVLLYLFGFTLIAALIRPGKIMAAMGCALAILAALFANIIRIVFLGSGYALTPEKIGIDVMAQPWHDIVGLVSLTLAAPIILIWAVRVKSRPVCESQHRTSVMSNAKPRPVWALAFLTLACFTFSVPHRPLDVGKPLEAPSLPHFLSGEIAKPLELSEKEENYFTQFGGSAARASYGDMGLLVTRTRSPLRHLHMPDDCLRGAGFDVSYLGMRFEPFPTASYRAVSPEGYAYLVAVSFEASDGYITASVAEAVWHWMRNRETVWTSIQRITPEDQSLVNQLHFEASVSAAFDLSFHANLKSGDDDVSILN